jgi:uncharacterized membrane protein YeaQ/YmgE (transglycosylase-associated protein family)
MGLEGLLWWAFFGLVAGVIAKLLMPGRDPGGCILTMVIGVAGALLGGFIASLLGFGGIEEFDLRSLVIAVLGSIILLAIFRALRGRR